MNYYHAIEMVEASEQEQLQQMYQLFDTRNKGFIDPAALVEAMKILGYEIDKRQVAQMVQYLDEGNKGIITKEAFMRFMTARIDYRDEQEELRGAFEYFDQLGKGSIREGDLQRVAEELGEEVSECGRIMAQADKDDDGNLSWDEFMRVIKKTSYY